MKYAAMRKFANMLSAENDELRSDMKALRKKLLNASTERKEAHKEIAALENQLAKAVAVAPPVAPRPVSDVELRFISNTISEIMSGKTPKIHLIRIVRACTGIGLKEAKEYVEDKLEEIAKTKTKIQQKPVVIDIADLHPKERTYNPMEAKELFDD